MGKIHKFLSFYVKIFQNWHLSGTQKFGVLHLKM